MKSVIRLGLGFALVLFLIPACLETVRAQAPSLLWTNIGNRVFAVDEQTNVYAAANGSITRLSAAGAVLGTLSINPYPGVVARDSAGNYYYAGVLPGQPVPNGSQYTNPACFVAKYTAGGSMVWSNGFGPTGFIRAIGIKAVALDADGNVYAGYTYNFSTFDSDSFADKFDAAGSHLWSKLLPKHTLFGTVSGSMRFGLVSPTNVYVVTYVTPLPGPWQTTISQLDSNGVASVVADVLGTPSAFGSSPPLIMNPGVEFYTTEQTDMSWTPYSLLTKRNSSGSIVWQTFIASDARTPVGRDYYGGVHVADNSGLLERYDSDGTPVWNMTLPAACRELFVDGSGNRFVSLANGVVGRLSGEILSPPVITNAPQGITVLSGSNAVFTVDATGSTPLRYFWIFNGTTVGTSKTLTLNNVTPSQAGFYSVIVSNLVNTVTSAPALLRVKRVAIYHNNQMLTNGTYVFSSPPTLSIRSTFPSGSTFYTLDGSAPSFASTNYTGPFLLLLSGTVRALAYSSDFLQSEEADAVIAVVQGQRYLTATSPGGGSVNLNPSGGVYVETNVVTATAVASPGWTFLHWQGDASGTNPTVNISMEQDKAIQAIFGTSLSTTVAGNGQIVVHPLRALYSYGEAVRLTGVPQPGNYFGAWGNAATGNTNPLNFSVVSSNPVVSSIFAAVPSGQAAFTLLINGRGQVDVNPRANVYPTNQSITLTAAPDPGRSFAGWTGDASGTQNPLVVLMNQDKMIAANFHSAPAVSAGRAGLEGMSTAGFRLSVIGDSPYAYQILASSNFVNWQIVGVVTNDLGEVQFLDPTATNLPVRFYRAAPVP